MTPVGGNVPICGMTLRSTSVPDVSSRTAHSFVPSARAHASDVATQSFSKSTRAMTFTAGSMYCANFSVARTVSPSYAAISACGTVPMPRDPHHSAFASVDTPSAPEMYAAYPSPVCTRWWSKRAGKNSTSLPPAASTMARAFVAMRVRRARTPRYGVSRCAKSA